MKVMCLTEKEAKSVLTIFAACMNVAWPGGKVSASRAEYLSPIPPFALDLLSRSSHTSDLKPDSAVSSLPVDWSYRVSAGFDWPRVSILPLGGIACLICSFYLSVAARAVV